MPITPPWMLLREKMPSLPCIFEKECWIPSLKDEEKTFSESHRLVGKGDNLAISRKESSSEKFVMSLFLTPPCESWPPRTDSD